MSAEQGRAASGVDYSTKRLTKIWKGLTDLERADIEMLARVNAMSRAEVIREYFPVLWQQVRLLEADEFVHGEGQDWATGGIQ